MKSTVLLALMSSILFWPILSFSELCEEEDANRMKNQWKYVFKQQLDQAKTKSQKRKVFAEYHDKVKVEWKNCQTSKKVQKIISEIKKLEKSLRNQHQQKSIRQAYQQNSSKSNRNEKQHNS